MRALKISTFKKLTDKFDVLRGRLLGNHNDFHWGMPMRAEGCRWELKARNSAVQLCAFLKIFTNIVRKLFLLFLHCRLFHEGCDGGSPELSRFAARSFITSISDFIHVPSCYWSIYSSSWFSCWSFSICLASNTCFGSLSWNIMLTGPNYLSWALSIQKSNGLIKFCMRRLKTDSHAPINWYLET